MPSCSPMDTLSKASDEEERESWRSSSHEHGHLVSQQSRSSLSVQTADFPSAGVTSFVKCAVIPELASGDFTCKSIGSMSHLSWIP